MDDIEEIFAAWSLRVEAGEDLPIEDLLRANPSHADVLRQLHDDWRFFAPVLDKVVPGVIPSDAGFVVPSISPRGDSGGDPPSSELLARLGINAPNEGRYRFRAVLGKGGGGVVLKVWDTKLNRPLAMKVVLGQDPDLLSGDTPQVDERTVTRFVDEARIASQLDHPGIVPVHELGSDETGRAFFTMKLVRGEDLSRIFEHVKTGHDGWNQTRALGVLLKVCEAMAYAHDKGVIHRDLKPANIMVGRYGEVHVMDWGLARVLGESLSGDKAVTSIRQMERKATPGSPLLSVAGSVLGTPVYMSPEQARGEHVQVDARSDIYAVGTILYELLAGRMPYVSVGTNPSPHAVLAMVLAGPPQQLETLGRRIAPELVAICERAIARESDLRYRSMRDLGADLRAFLEGRVVSVHDTGAWAETRKWVTRNKPLASSLAAVVLILICGVVVVGLQNVELLNRNLTIAARNAGLAAKTKEAEDAAMLAEVRRLEAENEKTRALLERAKADKNAEDTALVATFQSNILSELPIDEFGHSLMVELRRDLQQAMKRLGRTPESIDDTLANFDASVGFVNPTNVAKQVLETHIFEPAIESIEQRYTERPLLAAMMQTPLAEALGNLGLYELGTRAAQKAVDARLAGLGAKAHETVLSVNVLATLMQAQGQYSEAEALLRDTLRICRETFGNVHPDTLSAVNNLAQVLQAQRRFAEAEPLNREALAGYRARPSDQRKTLIAINNLAALLQALANFDEAEALCREGLAQRRTIFGENCFDTLTSMNNLAFLLKTRGKLTEAEPLYKEALAGLRTIVGDDHPATLTTINNLGALLDDLGRYPEAETLQREALAGSRRKLGDQHPDTISSINNLAILLKNQGRLGEAEPLYREALAGRRAAFGDRDSRTLSTINNFALFLKAQGKLSEAEDLAREAVAGFRTNFKSDDLDTLGAINVLAVILHDGGKTSEAEPLYREALSGRRAKLGISNPATVRSIMGLAQLLQDERRFTEAEPLLRERLEDCRARIGDAHRETLDVAVQLARVLFATKAFDEAASLLEEAIKQGQLLSSDSGSFVRDTRLRLRNLYRSWHKQDPSGGHDLRADEIDKDLGG